MLSEAYSMNRQFNDELISLNAPSYIEDKNENIYKERAEKERIKSKEDYEFQQTIKQQMYDDEISKS